MTILDPKTGERVVIDLAEARVYRDAARKAREDVNRLIDEGQAKVRKHYPQSDSGDEVSYEGC